DVAVLPDGKVLAVGDFHECASSGCADNANSIVVARLLTDGTLDRTFGKAGFAFIGPVLGANPDLAQGRGSVLQPDGNIVVTGSLNGQLVVARLTAGGLADSTFAGSGQFGSGVLVDDLIPNSDADRGFGRDVVLRPDGRIVVAGTLVSVSCGT